MADAVLIEIYASQVAKAKTGDIYAFVTSNHRDFSVPNGDHRQPHPDLAGLFDGGGVALRLAGQRACMTCCSNGSRTGYPELQARG